ncbi:antitoxin ParD1/3/4 [Methylosinus sp. sav-2]|jgi:antitoxin ParD1/3/4|uniref:type II toxin-antitoxin system ParD family antitoxin n=1 Tax=unclassified Methylosinus TaxID=2624500 RepID=UPI0004659BF0|nr:MULTISPECIES: type II toxin-antitoxin system ParD family antitoxin [unclassified Methylosinus]TDX61514.1 antitoxin ParD1/3/4 [Methylosinus sp. sav-2]
MPSNLSLERDLESAIDLLVSSGRYRSKSEVIREGVRLLQEREDRMAKLDAALQRGLADARAGRTRPADEVFAELRSRYGGRAGPRQE